MIETWLDQCLEEWDKLSEFPDKSDMFDFYQKWFPKLLEEYHTLQHRMDVWMLRQKPE